MKKIVLLGIIVLSIHTVIASDKKFELRNGLDFPVSYALVNLGEPRANLYLSVLEPGKIISSNEVILGTVEVVLDRAVIDPETSKGRSVKFNEKTSRVFKLKLSKGVLQKVGIKSAIPGKMYVEIYELKNAKDSKDNGLMLKPARGVKGNISESDIQWVISEKSPASDEDLLMIAWGGKDISDVAFKNHLYKVTALKAFDAIKAGASVNAQDEYGNTALHIAAGVGNNELVKTLLAKGADANKTDKAGRTPLMTAAEYGHDAIIKELLKKVRRTHIDAEDRWGNTALVYAVFGKHVTAAKLLLENGADVLHKARRSDNPQERILFDVTQLALQKSNIPMIKLIIKQRAKVVGEKLKKKQTDTTPESVQDQETSAMIDIRTGEGVITQSDASSFKKMLGISEKKITGADILQEARRKLRPIESLTKSKFSENTQQPVAVGV